MNNTTDNPPEKNLVKDILAWKKKREAVILAHVYQPGEIQDIADFTGDSLFLSQQAAQTTAKVIVFLRSSLYGRNCIYSLSRKNCSTSRN